MSDRPGERARGEAADAADAITGEEATRADLGPGAATRSGERVDEAATPADAAAILRGLAVPHPLAAFARARPDHLALSVEGRGFCARELVDMSMSLATWLLRHVPGDISTRPPRIALIGPPGALWVVALHAIGWLGASVVPIDPREPATAQAARAAGSVATLRIDGAVLHVAGGDAAASGWRLADADARARGGVDLAAPAGAAATAALHDPLLAEPTWPLEQERARLFTSGTTGAPKPVALTTAQLLFGALGGAIHLGHHRGDRWLACLAPWHVGGLSILFRAAWCQVGVELLPRFDALTVSAAIDGGAITQLSLVPVMLRQLVGARAGRRFPASLRFILVGGAAADEADLAAAEALGAPICTTWGMSESAAQVVTRAPDRPREAGVVGSPLPFVRVVEDGDRLAILGPQVGGRLLTADRGEVRGDGAVIIHGRADRAILSGGRTIDPAAIERVLAAHPRVAAVHVRGLADPRLGELVAAFVVPRAASSSSSWSATPREVDDPSSSPAPSSPAASDASTPLRAFAAAHLHPHDRPRVWALCAAIPTGAAGKVSAAVSDSLARDLEARRRQLLEEARRRVDPAEARQVDEGVHVLDLGVADIIAAVDDEADPQAAVVEAEPGDRDR